MVKSLAMLFAFYCVTGCTQKYYIVRHAEKAQAGDGITMVTTNDPPLTAAGTARAMALQQQLKHAKIRYVYSTNTLRTRSTAAPTAAYFHRPVVAYTKVDEQFLNELRHLKGNALIVGHSNTVDDLVNGLTQAQTIGDLPDSVYNKLFIVERKGKRFRFREADQNVPAPLPQP